MPEGKADPQRDWIVVTQGDVVLSGHDEEAQADARCARANAAAAELGIPTRYGVVANPNAPRQYHGGAA